MQELESGTFDPEAHWQAKCARLHDQHPEFSSDAYRFVQKAIFHDHLKMNVKLQQGSRNISELLENCRAYAKDIYGASAKAQLKSWGIETYLHVAEILILNGSGGLKGKLDPTLESRLHEMHEKMRENLRLKYGQSPFLTDES